MSGRIANNGIITMHAGDYFEAPLFLNTGYGCCPIQYELKPGDTLYFGIMEPNQPFEHALVRKVMTIEDLDRYGNPVIKLKTKDTVRLMPGLYYYEVKLLMADNGSDDSDDEEINGYIDTVIPKTKLYILD